MNDPERNEGTTNEDGPADRSPNEDGPADGSLYEAVTRDVLNWAVASVHSSPDLAERVQAAGMARRRRTRWGAAAAIAVVAAGTVAGLAALGPGQSGKSGVSVVAAASSSAAAVGPLTLPACAADASAYRVVAPSTAPTGPAVAGAPAAAVLCRYTASGKLARPAQLTRQSEVKALLAGVNGGTPYAGPKYCLESFGSAVIVFVYAQGSPRDVAVTYEPDCGSLLTKAGSYNASNALDGLITEWVGDWRVG